MPGPDRAIDRLESIVEMVGAIRRRMAGLTKDAFEEESDDIDLLAFRLAQIGEIASRLPDDMKLRHPAIPRRQIAGMRNLIVHEYRRVIPGRLWDTGESELDALHEMCLIELKQLRQ